MSSSPGHVVRGNRNVLDRRKRARRAFEEVLAEDRQALTGRGLDEELEFIALALGERPDRRLLSVARQSLRVGGQSLRIGGRLLGLWLKRDRGAEIANRRRYIRDRRRLDGRNLHAWTLGLRAGNLGLRAGNLRGIARPLLRKLCVRGRGRRADEKRADDSSCDLHQRPPALNP